MSTNEVYKTLQNSKPLFVLCLLQIIFGILAIISQIFHLVVSFYGYDLICVGFWTGLSFIITGSIGFCARKKASFGLILALAILSIICALLSLPLLAYSGFSAYFFAIVLHLLEGGLGVIFTIKFLLYLLMIIVGLAEIVVCIMTCVFSFREICKSADKKNEIPMYPIWIQFCVKIKWPKYRNEVLLNHIYENKWESGKFTSFFAQIFQFFHATLRPYFFPFCLRLKN